MDLESHIQGSDWWRDAAAMPDRHHAPGSGIMVTDHLLAVRAVVRTLLRDEPVHTYVEDLRRALCRHGLCPEELCEVLSTVALLHDIGKPHEDKRALRPHPTSGKPVTWRHPVVGMQAALELLPDDWPHKTQALHLVERHGTGWAWFRNASKQGQIPSSKAWAKLDRQVDPRPGHGVLCLALFKLADIDGHHETEDVPWFLNQANERLLSGLGLELPVPSGGAMEALRIPTPEASPSPE